MFYRLAKPAIFTGLIAAALAFIVTMPQSGAISLISTAMAGSGGDSENLENYWKAQTRKQSQKLRTEKEVTQEIDEVSNKYSNIWRKIKPGEMKKVRQKIGKASDRLDKKKDKIFKKYKKIRAKKTAGCCTSLKEFQRLNLAETKALDKADDEFKAKKKKILEDALKKSDPKAYKEMKKLQQKYKNLSKELDWIRKIKTAGKKILKALP